jgi:hypothetical protein
MSVGLPPRECTTDLRRGLGLYRWGDTRRTVALYYPEAPYAVYEQVYAFQRLFLVDDLFPGADGLAGVEAFLDPGAPEVIFRGLSHAEARTLLDALGCPLGTHQAEAVWSGDAVEVTVCGPADDVWIRVAGAPEAAADDADDPHFPPYDETDGERYDN